MLKTARLVIRPYQKMDEEAVYKVINSKGIYLTTLNIPYPYPKEQVGIWLQFTLKNSLYQRGYEWGIFDLKGEYIGNVGIVNIDWIHKHGEITYFIGETYWNNGYATEAVGAMLTYAFKDLKLERVQGRCMTHNVASLRVMQKCHFQYEGLARHEVQKQGIYLDVWYSAILREDYWVYATCEKQ
ncbi:MAG: GNAT family N-acetyltransferase [Cellulosilyticum sp.]|nr:GNAT family N-acetyltransferase [Cellulosilyticum sp.]